MLKFGKLFVDYCKGPFTKYVTFAHFFTPLFGVTLNAILYAKYSNAKGGGMYNPVVCTDFMYRNYLVYILIIKLFKCEFISILNAPYIPHSPCDDACSGDASGHASHAVHD